MMQPWTIQTNVQGSIYKKIVSYLSSKTLHFSIQIMYDLEENFHKIHLPN